MSKLKKSTKYYYTFFFVILSIVAFLFYVLTRSGDKNNKEISSLLDQTYVVNLDRTPERYKTMKKLLDHHQISHQRFSAVDGYKVRLQPLSGGKAITGAELKNKTAQLVPNETYNVLCTQNPKDQKYPIHYKHNDENAEDLPTAGEFGCLCSHFLIWQDVVEHDYKAALVLEDDLIEFNPGFLAFLNQVVSNLPKEALVHLNPVPQACVDSNATHVISLEFNAQDNRFLYKICNTTHALGTFAYIINSEMAKKLINHCTFEGKGVDNILADKANAQEISMYAAFPPLLLLDHTSENSLITQMGREET